MSAAMDLSANSTPTTPSSVSSAMPTNSFSVPSPSPSPAPPSPSPSPSPPSVIQGEDEFKFKKGANWQPDNVKTLMQWIHISAIYIDVLGESTKFYKRILRSHTIMNLFLSTLGGTTSLTQFNTGPETFTGLNTLMKVILTAITFIIALSHGYLKIYNIHDKVEKNVKLQQQWIQFGSTLTSEMQLPVSLRKDALYFIIKMNDTYSQLFKQHIVANRHILKAVARKNGVNHEVLTLSDLFERTIQAEAQRIEDAIKINLMLEETGGKPAKKLLGGVKKDSIVKAGLYNRSSMSNYVLRPHGVSTEKEYNTTLSKKTSLAVMPNISKDEDEEEKSVDVYSAL